MTGASKILTVSYGTFSCTLEGFDDPFSTMKAIAEYFRDLAADDRYFGAEPPVPDSAMLHRIAETATLRRVQAQVQDNGVVLRTGDAIDQNLPDMAAASAAPAPSVQTADAATVEMANAAARLARLRAEIDEKAAHIAALEARADGAAMVPVQAEETDAKVQADAAALAIPQPSESPIAGDAAAQIVDAFGASQANSDDADLDAEPTSSMDHALIDAAVSSRDSAADMAQPAPAAPAAPSALNDDYEDYDQWALDEVKDNANTPAAAQPEQAAGTEDAPAPKAAPFRVEVVRGGQTAPADDASDVADNAPIDGDINGDMPAPAPARTRIIRIRRVAKTNPAAYLPDAAQTTAAAAPATSLSAEAEAALAAELAALDGTAPPLAIPPAPPVARAKVNPSADTLDKLLARANLDLADTNVRRRQSALTHMKAAVAAANADRNLGDAIGKDRLLNNFRETMDAVAPAPATPNRASPLMLVSEQRIDRAGEAQPAKRGDAQLKLAPTPDAAVAAPENIFRATDEDVEFAGPQTNVFTGTETYEDFVDRLGAIEQVDLMEAAAIYVAHIEKQPVFRRRQLIRHMSSLPDALPMTREASVVIFNQLLRMGRFAEVEPGLFAVTDRSPMLAEALNEAD